MPQLCSAPNTWVNVRGGCLHIDEQHQHDPENADGKLSAKKKKCEFVYDDHADRDGLCAFFGGGGLSLQQH